MPQGLAIRATAGTARQAEAMKRTRLLQDVKEREGAEEVSRRLSDQVISVQARVGQDDRHQGEEGYATGKADGLRAPIAQRRNHEQPHDRRVDR